MIREIADRYGLWLDRQQGQHFLDNESVLEEIIDEAELAGDETVLEIGSGVGTLTSRLADVADHVITVERDDRLIPVLEQELAEYDNIDIVHADVMQMDLPEADVCISNIPYHLSSEIVEMLGRAGMPSVLMVQKEFADRLIAAPGSQDYSRLTVMANYWFLPVFLMDVSRREFFPQPRVDSAVVKLFPREDRYPVDDEEYFFTVVRALFTHKNRKVRNAFVDSRHILGMSKETAKAIRDDLPYADTRVIQLDLRKIIEVADELEELRD